ncbi:MAG TPA: energy transducer TonB [Luteolibacter sp.]|nr:energy transducer TonB [Luteolibacter sp.]
MQSIIHSLNIGTLATWMSVAGFGTVGVVVPHHDRPQPAAPVLEETILTDADFSLGDIPDASQPEGSGDGGGAAAMPEAIETPPEFLPSPPELPELAEFSPLPEIPDLPKPAAVTRISESGTLRATASSRRSGSTTASRTSSSNTGSRSGSSSATGGSGSGMSASARLAAGRMPAPNYPVTCRRKGQTGTVVVEFTIDRSGRVISAHAAEPSPWPLLDHEAVRTVRKWKFPPGDIMKLRRPIVFQLR